MSKSIRNSQQTITYFVTRLVLYITSLTGYSMSNPHLCVQLKNLKQLSIKLLLVKISKAVFLFSFDSVTVSRWIVSVN